MSDPDLLSQIHRVAEAVASLSGRYRDQWVPWRALAREVYGAEEHEPLVRALAEMPEARPYFAIAGSVVRLTAGGWQHLNDQGPTPPKSDCERIAETVIRYAARLASRDYSIIGVSGVPPRLGGRYVQAVEIESEEPLPSDTPVRLIPHSGASVHGKVVGQEPDGRCVYVAFDQAVYADLLPARLHIDRGFLLNRLAERLSRLAKVPVMASDLLSGRGLGVGVSDGDSGRVGDQLAGRGARWASFLWGPPGAGKTFAVTRFVARLLEGDPEERVLVVAPSNRAVDVATEQLIMQARTSPVLRDLIQDWRVLRYGYPRRPEVFDYPEVLGPSSQSDLIREAQTIQAAIREAERRGAAEADLAEKRAQFLAKQEELKRSVEEHIRRSRVVLTTATLAFMGEPPPIGGQQWATVVVDEVTMIPPAHCVFLASLAGKRLLLAGDPRQLGPVFEDGSGASDRMTWEWMGQDIFEASGISQGTGLGRSIRLDDGRLARISAQRRCAPEIWRRVERLYPKVEPRIDAARIATLRSLPPKAGDAVALLDTTEASRRGLAQCQNRHGSWQNSFTADLAIEVACALAAEATERLSVAIIAPYRAQVRLLREALRHESQAKNEAYEGLDAGTVHQFQGSDADVVIFDLVDGPGRPGLGALLKGDTGLRLATVAMTRAKGKLIVIGNSEWFRRHSTEEDNPLLHDLLVGHPVTPTPVEPWEEGSTADPTESPIEKALYDAMRNVPGLRSQFNVQFQIADREGRVVSRADFAFPKAKYAVYCDGAQWHLREDRWHRDIRQRNKLAELGWVHSVFTGAQLHRDAAACARQVAETLRARQSEAG